MERKSVKRHFTAEGHISTDERQGKFKTDAYYKRSQGLLQTGEALHRITDAHVKVEVIPTWLQGVRRFYSSPGFPLPEIEVVDGDLSLPNSFIDLAATLATSSPVKEEEEYPSLTAHQHQKGHTVPKQV